MSTQAIRDALQTARRRIVDERAAVDLTRANPDSLDHRFAVRELAHQHAIAARLELRLAERL